jgi:hypothetical protein
MSFKKFLKTIFSLALNNTSANRIEEHKQKGRTEIGEPIA